MTERWDHCVYLDMYDNFFKTLLVLVLFAGYTFQIAATIKAIRKLIQATKRGDLKKVIRLLQEGHNANEEDQDGNTPLMFAAATGHLEILKTLLNHPDTDVNHDNRKGYTALMKAAQHGFTEGVKILLKHPEIQVNHKNLYNKTALDLVKKEHAKIAHLLETQVK